MGGLLGLRLASSLLLGSLLLAACGGSSDRSTSLMPPVTVNPAATSNLLPPGTIVERRVIRPIVLDNGTLRIDPAPPTLSARVTFQHAVSVVKAAQTYDQGSLNQSDIGLGVVHLATRLSRGLPSYSARPAWVTILAPQTNVSCASIGSGSDSKPGVHVVLLDAQTGSDVLDYLSRGNGPCGGQITGPSVERAQEIVSIPWTPVAETQVTQQQLHQLFPPNAPNVPESAVNWVIRYTIPRCATIFDSPGLWLSGMGQPPTLYVDAQLPISPPPTCAPARTVTNNFGPESVPVSQAQHAPTGIATGPEL